MSQTPHGELAQPAQTGFTFSILIAISLCHLLNDMMQSLLPAIYPMIKEDFNLSFSQIGLITFAFQLAGSIFQPLVGAYTDHKPQPYSLSIGMGFTLIGLLILSFAPSFIILITGAILMGLGSSIFHPESSRVARMASGGHYGLAQSIFQVGGNLGSSLGPLLAALVVVHYGQSSLAWFSAAALIAFCILINIGHWYKRNHLAIKRSVKQTVDHHLTSQKLFFSVVILLILIFSKYFYIASISNYFTFYLIDKFDVSIKSSQLYLFLFLLAVAVGTIIGGPIGDKIGRKYVIWVSILGVTPFTLLLPYANLFWTGILIATIGVILASAFSAIIVYAQELLPGKIGMVSGLFFGFAFGMGALGAAVLGKLADETSIAFVYHLCSFLPLLGILTIFLPNMKQNKK